MRVQTSEFLLQDTWFAAVLDEDLLREMAERDEESVAVCNTDGRTEDHSLCPRGLRAPEPTGGEREEEGGALQCVHKDYGEDGKPTEHARLRPIRLRTIRLRPISRVEIGRSRNWPKSKLAEVELAEIEIGRSRNWRSRTDGVCSVSSFSLSFPLSFFFSFSFFSSFSSHSSFSFCSVAVVVPAGASHDSPRTPNVHFQGWRFKHHPNSTKGPQREGEKKENCGGRGQKKRDILGPTLRGTTFSRFGLPPFGGPGPWWSQNSTSKN